MARLPIGNARFFAGWRGLGRFWLLVIAVAGVLAAVLAALGPPGPPARPVAHAGPAAASPPLPGVVVLHPQPVRAQRPDQPGRESPGPVHDPDPALLEPAPGGDGKLPVVAQDGRMSLQVYAAGFDRGTQRPRVGLLLAGIGLSEADSFAAIRSLPSGVTLAVSPYAAAPAKVLEMARAREHEYLLSLPMEPQGFPNNDPGPKALMTNEPLPQNLERLSWLLSRIQGYVGVTSALGAMRGERFEAMADQLDPVLEVLGRRGLLWVDTRAGQGALPKVWTRSIDLVVDEPASQASLDARLDQLARLAQEKGSALGLATAPSPVTVERIAAWANGLAARGLVLAPVSALVLPPVGEGGGK